MVRFQKREKKSRKKIIVASIFLTIFILLIGVSLGGYIHLKKNIRYFRVTDIQIEQPISTSVVTEIKISATYPQYAIESDVNVYMLPNRCTRKIHIWVYVPTKSTIPLDVETYVNQTIYYSFPCTGTWQLIAGDYIADIEVF